MLSGNQQSRQKLDGPRMPLDLEVLIAEKDICFWIGG